jgi:hypothetical protein
MIHLTDEQAQELTQPEPLAIDPRTQEAYVLVRQGIYARWKSLLARDDYDPEEGTALLNAALAEDDSDDPLLDSYQHYGKRP